MWDELIKKKVKVRLQQQQQVSQKMKAEKDIYRIIHKGWNLKHDPKLFKYIGLNLFFDDFSLLMIWQSKKKFSTVVSSVSSFLGPPVDRCQADSEQFYTSWLILFRF